MSIYHKQINASVVKEAKAKAVRPRLHPTEEQEHLTLMEWARLQPYNGGKVADYLHHSPNGGARHKAEAAKFKRMGTLPGFPDLFCFVPSGAYNGLFVELKAQKGEVSANQKNMIKRLTQCGFKCHVCYGFEAAKRVISEYLGVVV